MVEIVVPVTDLQRRGADVSGVIVTGYLIAATRPNSSGVRRCSATRLLRIYEGYGKVRAETGDKPPKKGFGKLISGAEISDTERNRGQQLWLRVQD